MTTTISPFVAPTVVSFGTDLDGDVDYLLDLDDADFDEVVFDNIGPDAPNRMWEALLDPDVVDRTRNALAAKITSVNRQLAERGPRALAPDEFADWRRRAAGYITILGRRQHQANVAAREVGLDVSERKKLTEIEKVRAHADRMSAERSWNHNMLVKLALAVNEHRLACRSADLDPEPHDVALWSMLDDLRLPGAGVRDAGPSLAKMLVDGTWVQQEHTAEPVAAGVTEGATA